MVAPVSGLRSGWRFHHSTWLGIQDPHLRSSYPRSACPAFWLQNYVSTRSSVQQKLQDPDSRLDLGSESHLYRSWQARPNPAKLVRHAHDHLPAEGMANQHLGEQFEVPKELQNISCSALHSVAAGHLLDVRRVPMAAQVNKKNLPRGKGLCNVGYC